MKSYLKGFISGLFIVFGFIILLGFSQNNQVGRYQFNAVFIHPDGNNDESGSVTKYLLDTTTGQVYFSNDREDDYWVKSRKMRFKNKQ